jgi:dihydroorotate dehydrogenase
MSIYISPPFGTWINLKNTISIRGSFTPDPRSGLIRQIFKTLRYTKRGWVNKIGLRNPGIRKVSFDTSSVVSLAALNDDWDKFIDIVPAGQKIELNLSCPNVYNYFINPATLTHFILKYDWISCKLSPNNDIFNQCDFLSYYGINRIHLSNIVSVDKGGLSGKEVKKFNLQYIPQIQKQFPGLEIIAGGGIYSPQDFCDYKILGITNFSLSTIFFTPWKVKKVLQVANN